MICPHCDYVHGLVYKGTDIVDVNGDFGDWWTSPLKMEKFDGYSHLKSSIFACPKCLKTFISDDDTEIARNMR